MKATNDIVTQEFLDDRCRRSSDAGYEKAKWITFCECMLAQGYDVELYEARETFSKYITCWNGPMSYKVRFSNHRPNKQRELMKDCDYFVGWTHTGVRTTEMAIEATIKYLGDVE